MKGQSLVSNVDEIILINQSLSKKIQFLQHQKQTYEKHIKDLRYSLNLNKESLSLLASEQNQEAVKKLNAQNLHLHKKLNQYYEEALDHTGRLLIEEQLKNQEKKFYNQRIVQYQNTMIQLRKYLQDKEDSFSAIVMRLRKYEDINELMLSAKIDERYRKDLKENPIPAIIKQLSEERDKYKQIYERMKLNTEDFAILRNCLENSKSYLELRQIYTTMRSKEDPNRYQNQQRNNQNFLSLIEKSKNTTASSFVQNTANNGNAIKKNHQYNNNGDTGSPRSPSRTNGSASPNKQLIRLLKKQKLNNQILEQALNDAIQKNQQLIEQNKYVIEANMEYELTIQKLQAKVILLEQELSRYQKSLHWKKYWKSKCDLSKPKLSWLGQFEARGDQPGLNQQSLKSDMSRLSQFLMVCVPGQNRTMKKSLSSNQLKVQQSHKVQTSNIEEDDLEIQEV